MHLYRLLIQHRLVITILLALIGIGLMAFYAVCDTACSYLRGDIFGIDLKYIGVGYMAVIIILALLKQADLITNAGCGRHWRGSFSGFFSGVGKCFLPFLPVFRHNGYIDVSDQL
ncbi:MAG: hypothetical protein MZV70_54890 [Desulfobacterales bacterium]|nr:hypothetical protein [Desulfobacterales bacterium]